MIIALEEHYFDPSWNQSFDDRRHAARGPSPLFTMLEELGERRIADMDRAGIDVQVLSHAPPGAQGLRDDCAVGWSEAANDALASAVAAYPTRFAGFASLPTADPAAAARELERAVLQLGFKGGMIHSLGEGPFLDEKRYWPIFECAAALNVPLYLHPADPNPAVVEAYYKTYSKTHPIIMRAAWGFAFETGTQAVRLVLSGMFERYPTLKIILGHMGETIPFQLARIDASFAREKTVPNFRDLFTRHFYVTTSGFFSDAALRCCISELGVHRVLFSVDWPYVTNEDGVRFINRAPLSPEERARVTADNARELLGL